MIQYLVIVYAEENPTPYGFSMTVDIVDTDPARLLREVAGTVERYVPKHSTVTNIEIIKVD